MRSLLLFGTLEHCVPFIVGHFGAKYLSRVADVENQRFHGEVMVLLVISRSYI